MNCTIVGLPYYQHKKYRDEIKEGSIVFLAHDEDNPHSPSNTAVACYYRGIGKQGFDMIGHVAGNQSADILEMIEYSPRIQRIGDETSKVLRAYVEVARPSSLIVGLDEYDHVDSQKYVSKQPLKESTMLNKLITANKTTATTAAYFEAGRIATNQLVKLIAPRAPMMARGYIDTPVGKLVLANAASVAAEQFRPTDVQLKKVTAAMMANAYQELIRTVDIEGILNEFTNSDGLKKAFASAPELSS